MDGEVQAIRVQTADSKFLDTHLLDAEGYGMFDLEVVGESKFQENLWKLFGDPPKDGERKEHECHAIVLLDGESENGVSVQIDGYEVGYLGAEDAAIFQDNIDQANLEFGITMIMARCDAVIVGGFLLRDGSRAHLGVKLDLYLDYPEDEE